MPRPTARNSGRSNTAVSILRAAAVTGHGMIFMSTVMRAKLLAVRENTAKPDTAWSYTRGVSTQPSPLLVGDELYFITESGGLVTCLDAHTGRNNGGTNRRQLFRLTHALNGRIYFHSREGVPMCCKQAKSSKCCEKPARRPAHG